ncbi:MAG TPA: S6e family ribosomal protein [Candidatus Nanoarchaeia archaeon]|nr:S6e family ribosomal protein [Candidatus Nanoarchaeia archaeon]
MVFKINISESGKTFHLEVDSEDFIGKKIGDKLSGSDLSGELSGYEFEITGTSDNAGFPGKKDVSGPMLKRILLKKGPFLRKTPHKGFRRKKTVRGNEISLNTSQINVKVLKNGGKKLNEIFPDQGAGKAKKE